MSKVENEWTNEFTLEFLEIYQSEPVIWNPTHRLHKDKIAVNDAWKRIGEALDMAVIDLKRKKDSLMASFRHHLRRKKASIKSGAAPEDIYKTSWFAYDAMEKFLSPVYENKPNLNTENTSNKDHEEDLNIGTEDSPTPAPSTSISTPPATVHRKRRRCNQPLELEDSSKETKQAFSSTQNSVLAYKKEDEDDECDLFGKLLAKKLRRIPENEREHLMYEIDGLFLNRRHYNPYPSGQESAISLSKKAK